MSNPYPDPPAVGRQPRDLEEAEERWVAEFLVTHVFGDDDGEVECETCCDVGDYGGCKACGRGPF